MEVLNFTAWVAQQRILQASDIVAADDLLIIGKKMNKTRSGRGYEEFVISVANFFASVGNGYTFVQDEGVALPQRTIMNFVGTGVTASDIGGKTTITIAAGGHAIEDEGVALISRPIMNYVGFGVIAADVGGKTVITIPGITVQDEGVALTQRSIFNFVGTGVVASDIGGKTTITINSGGHVIEDEGVALTQRANMNFVGAGVIATDAGGKTVVTIAGAHIIEDEGVPLGTQRTSMNFTGNMVSVFDNGGKTEVNINLTLLRKIIYVDAVNGNNALATTFLYDQRYSFLTLTAAHTAAGATDLIIVLPGAYSHTGNLFRDNGSIELKKGATLTWNPVPGLLTGNNGAEFTIYGEGNLVMTNTIDCFDATCNKTFNLKVANINVTAGNGLCFMRGFVKLNVDCDTLNMSNVAAAGVFFADAPTLNLKFKRGSWSTTVQPGFQFNALTGAAGRSYIQFDELLCSGQAGVFHVQSGAHVDYQVHCKGGQVISTATQNYTIFSNTAGKVYIDCNIICLRVAIGILGSARANIKGTFDNTSGPGTFAALEVNNISANVIIEQSNVFSNRPIGATVNLTRGLVLMNDTEVTNEASGVATARAVQVGIDGATSAGIILAMLKNVYLLCDPATSNAGGSSSLYVDFPSGNNLLQYTGPVITNGGANGNAIEVIGAFSVITFAAFSRVPKI